MRSGRGWTDVERRVRESAVTGALVDLRTGAAGADDPRNGGTWESARVVRAEVLVELLTANPSTDTLPVRLRGARIVGPLDLEAKQVTKPIVLQNCYFEQPVNLRQAQASVVRFPGCHMPGLVADQLETRGDLDLRDGFSTACASLIDARIGGSLYCNGATLTNDGSVTLNGYNLTVGRDLNCTNAFRSSGCILLINAEIGGILAFTGATLRNPGGTALQAQGMTVGRALFLGSSIDDTGGMVVDGCLHLIDVQVNGFVCCWDTEVRQPGGTAIAALGLTVKTDLLFGNGFSASGEVDLRSADIGGDLDLTGTTLTNPGRRALAGEGLKVHRSVLCRDGFTADGTVDLTNAQAQGCVDLTGAELRGSSSTLSLNRLRSPLLVLKPATPPEEVDLRHAQVGLFTDDPTTWPERIRLRNFTYDALDDHPTARPTRRLAWLRREAEGYLPQPYEQLAHVYRRDGQEEAARRVAIAKQWRRRRVLGLPGKIWNWLLYLTVGYGYRAWQAGLWLTALLGLGTYVFDQAHPANIVSTKQPAPEFTAWAYTLDILLPVIKLGQEDVWQPRGTALYCSWAIIGAGWLLTTTVIAGLTNVLKRA